MKICAKNCSYHVYKSNIKVAIKKLLRSISIVNITFPMSLNAKKKKEKKPGCILVCLLVGLTPIDSSEWHLDYNDKKVVSHVPDHGMEKGGIKGFTRKR